VISDGVVGTTSNATSAEYDDEICKIAVGAGNTLDDVTIAEEATVGAVTGEVTSSDGTIPEVTIVVAGRGKDAFTGAESSTASKVTDDTMDAGTLPAEQASAGESGLELPRNGGEDILAADERERGCIAPLRSRPVASGRLVQHLGSWLLMSLAQHHGLHEEAERVAGGEATRVALDATLAALAIGERTVEGVRRLATSSAPLLLRCDHTPTANAVRRRLHEIADDHGAVLMARVGERYLEAMRSTANEPAVFYVDNHLRTYTGKEVVRKGWRMQDKRVLPGASDYYVHDEDGRPVFRIDTPSHDSLCQWLMPIVARLRAGLGAKERGTSSAGVRSCRRVSGRDGRAA
jgi:hypothetical protein